MIEYNSINEKVKNLIKEILENNKELREDISKIGHSAGAYMIIYSNGDNVKLPRALTDDLSEQFIEYNYFKLKDLFLRRKINVTEYMNYKWREGDNYKCPLCDCKTWVIGDLIFGLHEDQSQRGGFISGGGNQILPIIPITCKNCGNTIFINAKISGIGNK